MPLAPGTDAFREGDAPVVFYVLDGEIRLESTLDTSVTPALKGRPTESAAESLTVGPGALIGMSATLAGLPMGCRGVVTQPGVALRLDQDAIFGVLADHVDLLQGLFSEVMQERGLRASPDRSR